jgi:hypothetical protein
MNCFGVKIDVSKAAVCAKAALIGPSPHSTVGYEPQDTLVYVSTLLTSGRFNAKRSLIPGRVIFAIWFRECLRVRLIKGQLVL